MSFVGLVPVPKSVTGGAFVPPALGQGRREMLLRDVLRQKGGDVTTVEEAALVADVVRILADERIGAVVVLDRLANLAGLFSERELVLACAAHGDVALGMEVRGLMNAAVITGVPEERIDDALRRMTLRRSRHMPVIEKGRLVGIISLGDLVKHRLEEKELEAGVLLDLTRRHG